MIEKGDLSLRQAIMATPTETIHKNMEHFLCRSFEDCQQHGLNPSNASVDRARGV
jgi:hypothetical protein